MRTLAALAFLALPAAAQAKLEIRDVQASHGQLGPERKSNEYVAGDEVFFRFTLAGVLTDADGRMRCEMKLTVIDPKGKQIPLAESPLQGIVALGGDAMPANASFEFDLGVLPGEYVLTVEVIDRLAKETASFQRKIICKPLEFALVRLRFHQDEAGKVPARIGGTVSQTLFVKFQAIGFDRSQNEVDVEMEIVILDEAGKPVMPKPIRRTLHNEKPAEVKTIDRINLSASLTLNRPGKFALRIVITDKQTKKKVSFEAPLQVAPM
jgi:hypothetical protein